MQQLVRTGGARVVNLDDLGDRSAAEADPDGFAAQYPRGLLAIDEIQRVPELLTSLRRQSIVTVAPGALSSRALPIFFRFVELRSRWLAAQRLFPLKVSVKTSSQVAALTSLPSHGRCLLAVCRPTTLALPAATISRLQQRRRSQKHAAEQAARGIAGYRATPSVFWLQTRPTSSASNTQIDWRRCSMSSRRGTLANLSPRASVARSMFQNDPFRHIFKRCAVCSLFGSFPAGQQHRQPRSVKPERCPH